MVRYSAWLYFDGGKAKVSPTRWVSRAFERTCAAGGVSVTAAVPSAAGAGE